VRSEVVQINRSGRRVFQDVVIVCVVERSLMGVELKRDLFVRCCADPVATQDIEKWLPAILSGCVTIV